jgi:hypothetical protein
VLSPLINLFTPQQKLISNSRAGAKITKRYDTAQTPYQRLPGHPDALDPIDTGHLTDVYQATNPAAARRDVGQLCATLLERVKRKTATARAKQNAAYLSRTKLDRPKRASSDESTTRPSRAS